jgi:hypothetical protein
MFEAEMEALASVGLGCWGYGTDLLVCSLITSLFLGFEIEGASLLLGLSG